MPFNLGPTELIIVLVIVMILFGVGKLHEIGGAVGKALREFKESQKSDKEKTSKSEDNLNNK